jgi:hypothetical protein
MPHNRIVEMRETRYGSACGHSHWSHRRKMEEGASADKLHFGVSEIATWRVEMPHNRIVIMPKCEKCFGSACGHSHWSHRQKMEEGASVDKLHFGVSGIGTWRVTKSLPRGSLKCRSAKWRNECKIQ